MTPRRILFIQTAFLGDVVFSTALLGRIRQLFPAASVTVLASPRGGGILKNQPFVDHVLLFDKTGRERGLRSLLGLITNLRTREFDLVVSPHRSFRSALVARFCGAPMRAGFLGGPGWWAYNLGIPFDKGQKVPYRRELAIAERVWGETAGPGRPRLEIGAADRGEARGKLEDAGATPGRPLAGFVTGTVWPTKKWPFQNYLAAAGELSRRGVDVAVFGGPAEVREAAGFDGYRGTVNLVGKTTLEELPAFLSCCDVVLAADTGPLHLAMALEVPVVALFGPTDERQFEFRDGDRCLAAAVPCRPCSAHGSKECPEGDWICMPEISVGEVVAAVADRAGAGRNTRDEAPPYPRGENGPS